ncbi:hypothetical protein ACTG9Q_13160 [Actinokineospora sp. 24-640]
MTGFFRRRGARGLDRRAESLARVVGGELDLIMPPPYDTSETEPAAGRQRVEELIGRLTPNGLDAGSRDVLNNVINDWADAAVARLDSERDERQAVGDVLIGLAREEVARRKPLYDRDLTRALHYREALEAAFVALTGKNTATLLEPAPDRFADHPLRSTLGDMADDSQRDDEAPLTLSTHIPARPIPHTSNGHVGTSASTEP